MRTIFITAQPSDLREGDVVNFRVHGTRVEGEALRRGMGGDSRFLMSTGSSWYVTRDGEEFCTGISDVQVRRGFGVGDRVRLASRYELDNPGVHSWDDVAVVNQTGTITEFESATSAARQIAVVRWDHETRMTRRVWLGCLAPESAAPVAPEPTLGGRTVQEVLDSPVEGDTYRDGRGDFWVYRGSGWDYRTQGTTREPGWAHREQQGSDYVRNRGGQGRLLTPAEEEVHFGVTELTRARRELEEVRARHRRELEELGDKASKLGRETGMCGVLEEFMDTHDIPHKGVPVTGTVTVTYQVSGHIPRDRMYSAENAVRIEGGVVSVAHDTVVITPTITESSVNLA